MGDIEFFRTLDLGFRIERVENASSSDRDACKSTAETGKMLNRISQKKKCREESDELPDRQHALLCLIKGNAHNKSNGHERQNLSDRSR